MARTIGRMIIARAPAPAPIRAPALPNADPPKAPPYIAIIIPEINPITASINAVTLAIERTSISLSSIIFDHTFIIEFLIIKDLPGIWQIVKEKLGPIHKKRIYPSNRTLIGIKYNYQKTALWKRLKSR